MEANVPSVLSNEDPQEGERPVAHQNSHLSTDDHDRQDQRNEETHDREYPNNVRVENLLPLITANPTPAHTWSPETRGDSRLLVLSGGNEVLEQKGLLQF